MSTYYRWISKGPDLMAAQRKLLQVSASPRHACWIFDMSEYKPSAGVHGDRVLVAFTFTSAGEDILADESKWINFPGTAFKGEAQHPDGIIVKTNEPGAYGVGCSLLAELNECIKEARLANRKELSKALGGAVPQSEVANRMRNQKWSAK
jgi:hypothetical protein